jgi:hypothetical protein
MSGPILGIAERRKLVDPSELVAAVASGLIAAMTSDVWEQAHSAIVELWRRVHPGRAQTIGAELVEARQEAIAAGQGADASAEAELIADWQRRLQRLVKAAPEITADLQRIFDELLGPALDQANQARASQIIMSARASGHGQVFQAGRDMHVTEH